MRVLVTGDRRYLGSVVRQALTNSGFCVLGCDLGWFDEPGSAESACDFRDLASAQLKDIDAVVHLAAVCNDACGDISAAATRDINHIGSVDIARLARAVGVRSFVLASSCSVYGDAGDVLADESHLPVPLTAYAESKLHAERDVLAMAGPDYHAVALRFATLYGYSPSFRSDLMVSTAWRENRIYVSGTGAALRPMLHVRDAAAAIHAVVEADPLRSTGKGLQRWQERGEPSSIGRRTGGPRFVPGRRHSSIRYRGRPFLQCRLRSFRFHVPRVVAGAGAW